MLPSHYFNDIFCLHKSLQSNSEGYVLCSTSLIHRLNVIFLLHEAAQSSREDSYSSYSRTGRGHKKRNCQNIPPTASFFGNALPKILLYASKFLMSVFTLYFWQFGNDKPNILIVIYSDDLLDPKHHPDPFLQFLWQLFIATAFFCIFPHHISIHIYT